VYSNLYDILTCLDVCVNFKPSIFHGPVLQHVVNLLHSLLQKKIKKKPISELRLKVKDIYLILAIWYQSVPATCYPAQVNALGLNPGHQAGTRFTYPGDGRLS